MMLINLFDPWFWIAVSSISFNPLFWNALARFEHRTRSLSRLASSPYLGCYILGFTIFTLGLVRDYLYAIAMDRQPTLPILASESIKILAILLFVTGNVLVLSSMYQLGVTGTYLGDYFGILMDKKVTAFPFNLVNNPMYIGSTMCFYGSAFWKQSVAGLVLSTWVWVVYHVAIKYEEPFTAHIYSQRNTISKGNGISPSRAAAKKKK